MPTPELPRPLTAADIPRDLSREYFVEVWVPCPTCYGAAKVAVPGGGQADCPEPLCIGSKYRGHIVQRMTAREFIRGAYVRPFTDAHDPG